MDGLEGGYKRRIRVNTVLLGIFQRQPFIGNGVPALLLEHPQNLIPEDLGRLLTLGLGLIFVYPSFFQDVFPIGILILE